MIDLLCKKFLKKIKLFIAFSLKNLVGIGKKLTQFFILNKNESMQIGNFRNLNSLNMFGFFFCLLTK